MKKIFALTTVILLGIISVSMQVNADWEPLLDKNLSKWNTYLSYSHKVGYDGKIPTDQNGNTLAPIGYNQDPNKVFSVLNEKDGPVLRISGQIYGCLFTKSSYRNYHLKLQVKWGKDKYNPRKDKLKDSGILYHSVGDAGVEYWRSWMLSQEFQVMEGHMGDFWCQANSAIDIRSYPSEGTMNAIASSKQSFRPFKKGGDFYCMRSENAEKKTGEWNTLELICYEGKSLHIVNGKVVMVLRNSRFVNPDGTEKALDSGKIQLQSEAAEVFYKDIKIMQLNTLPKEYLKLF